MSAGINCFVKGSVRVIQPIADPYKGFTVRRINKGRVLGGFLIRQAYPYRHVTGGAVRARANDVIILKDDRSVLIKHIVGPCFSGVRRKQVVALFRTLV